MIFTSEQGRKAFQQRESMCQEIDENIRCLVNVKEFSVNLDAADEEGMESRNKKGLR